MSPTVTALALAAALAASGPPVPEPMSESVGPSDDYPERALRLGKEGQVVLLCTPHVDRPVTGCEILSETPPDAGFGVAALRLSRSFHRPPLAGESTVRGKVEVPVSFRLPDSAPAPTPVKAP